MWKNLMNIPIFAGIFLFYFWSNSPLILKKWEFQRISLLINNCGLIIICCLNSNARKVLQRLTQDRKMRANLATPLTETSQGQLSFAYLHWASESMNSITRNRNCFELYFVWPQQHSEKAKSNFLFCGQAVDIYKCFYIFPHARILLKCLV